MIKILIVEDEIPARKKLRRFIEELETPTEIIAEIDAVQPAIDFLKIHQPDLIFSDIELLDGSAFEIYRQVKVSCPIVFTTAYDRFWMDAFEGNGIAYLLKPFSQDRFQKAWDKYSLFSNSETEQKHAISSLTELIKQSFSTKEYKKRFAVNTPRGIYFLETQNILFFEADEGLNFAYDTSGKRHLLSGLNLTQIEEQVNPADFFRINRSELVHKAYVENIERYNKNTLAIKLSGYPQALKTSQSQTAAFREWIER
jgi:DNA-binding LytR/AlgR family response regulator